MVLSPGVSKLAWFCAVGLGVVSGVGGYTFHYADGLSYFSKDPKACANCHIMNAEYDSWQKSSHHIAATCADCHLPHSGLPKLIAKAENGYHHSKGFTLEDFHEPILIKPKNARILQEACTNCHADFIHYMVSARVTSDGSDNGGVRCVHCHRSVGHGPIQ